MCKPPSTLPPTHTCTHTPGTVAYTTIPVLRRAAKAKGSELRVQLEPLRLHMYILPLILLMLNGLLKYELNVLNDIITSKCFNRHINSFKIKSSEARSRDTRRPEKEVSYVVSEVRVVLAAIFRSILSARAWMYVLTSLWSSTAHNRAKEDAEVSYICQLKAPRQGV